MFNVIELSPNLSVIDSGAELTMSAEAQERASAIWAAEKQKRGEDLFDGHIFNVTDITREVLTGHFIDYSLSLAQYCEPALFEELAVRSLAVSGIVTCPQGIVFGLRNENLTADAGMWELVASGGVDKSVRLKNGTVDVREQFLNELHEEVNIPPEAVEEMFTSLLLEDSLTHVCDIVIEAKLSIGVEQIYPLFNECGREEYVSIDIISEQGVKSFLQLMKGAVTPATLEILAHKGYVKLAGTPE
ncbi:MAG: hypothetical protein VW802_05160 [Rhodospirillaceae bacterium]|jgi:hypothetical protein